MKRSRRDRRRGGSGALRLEEPWWQGKRVVAGGAGLAIAVSGLAYLGITDHQATTELTGAPRVTAAAVAPGDSAASAPKAGDAVPSKLAQQINRMRQQSASAPPSVPGLRSVTTGSLKTGILRVISARGDLTGNGEMAWVVGMGTPYEGTPCTQTFRFAPGAPVQVKNNLLICWRITAKKSVVAVVVDDKGHPSHAKALSALDAEWRRMG